MNQVITAVLVMGLLGFFFSIIISYFSKKFEVKKDDRLAEVIAALPGANCGACGCASCEDFAKKFLTGAVEVNGCKAGGKKTAEKLAKLHPLIQEARLALPGANCGACGCASCDSFAEAFFKGEQPFNGCKAGGKKTAEKLTEIKKKIN
jgi:Na+-translocating ferredoxin:NAD+ oxidoreductase RNF subunit RnfB